MQGKGINKLPTYMQHDTVSPATKLLQKRRKMYEIHQSFETQKQQFKKQEEQFKKIEQDIRKRDLKIQVQLINFCQFIQDNETKKKKATQRLEQEQKACQQKQRQRKNLQAQENDLKRHKQRFEKKTASLRKYQEYLQKVKNAYPDQFPEILQILARYNTLKHTNDQLNIQRIQTEARYQKLKIDAANSEKSLNQQILTLNNEIKQSSKRLQQKINQRNQLQATVESSNNDSSNMNLSLGRILIAINNLYEKCAGTSKKIKHEIKDYMQKKNQGKSSWKKQDKKLSKQKQEQLRKQKQESIEQKCKGAVAMLKCIVDYMKDFKKIIDQYNNSYKKPK